MAAEWLGGVPLDFAGECETYCKHARVHLQRYAQLVSSQAATIPPQGDRRGLFLHLAFVILRYVVERSGTIAVALEWAIPCTARKTLLSLLRGENTLKSHQVKAHVDTLANPTYKFVTNLRE